MHAKRLQTTYFNPLKEICNGDVDVLISELPQIKTRYFCHMRNAYRTLTTLKAEIHGTVLSHAIFRSARCLRQATNCIQLASYNIVCGYDCRRVLDHVFKGDLDGTILSHAIFL